MSDYNNAEFPELEELNTSLAEIEMVVGDYEPKVRELNRKLKDALGAHPSSPTGAWFYLAKAEDGTYFIALEDLKISDFSKVIYVLGQVAALVENAPKLVGAEPETDIDLGPAIVGDIATLQFVPRTHVRVQRGNQ